MKKPHDSNDVLDKQSASSSSSCSKIQTKTSDTVVSSSCLSEMENCNEQSRIECISIASISTETIDNKKLDDNSSTARWRPPTPPLLPPTLLSSSPSTNNDGGNGPDNHKRKWFHTVQMPFLFYKQKQQQQQQQQLENEDATNGSAKYHGFSELVDDSLVLTSNQSTEEECSNKNDSDDDSKRKAQGLKPRHMQGQTFDFTECNTHEKALLDEEENEQAENPTKKYSSGSSRRKTSNVFHNILGRHSHSGRKVHHDHYIQYGNGNGNDHFHDDDYDKYNDKENEQEQHSSNYQMMKSHHGSRSRYPQALMLPESTSSLEEETSFFYSGMDQLEDERRKRHVTNHVAISSHSTSDPTLSSTLEFFNHETRRKFVEDHALLNLPMEIKNPDSSKSDVDSDTDYDFTTLFTFGSSPLARERNSRRSNSHSDNCRQESQVPAIADIRKSSLSYIRQGRIEMRLPGDNIRLVMDEYIEPGILSIEMDMDVERGRDNVSSLLSSSQSDNDKDDIKSRLLLRRHSHDDIDDEEACSAKNDVTYASSDRETPLLLKKVAIPDGNSHHVNKRPSDLRYILTVDQNLYKRILSEMADSRTPCGLYFCCHDAVDGSKSVDISVAVFILIVVFVLLFIGTCMWPTA
mmetsp:Transcript_897/g.1549  ORF Transcript_897/g.1549 Transcript_897/m.1549 type:complete len:634 (+) Transcript_897:95-1996(+)|eukprot:CAMPEP_0176497770 /NCGR_PEP_ID=MMETSP0200_2-20121128/11918_1 /TAXON_ID=947934 /ORGANISM="Chaetoceros sp., Strain GSL56" /LENGTH=633 /DNA_ID=CAMNT_0017895839 /DNA_START=95 /DNA_END=1996 /DNA_ORIENTATION=-